MHIIHFFIDFVLHIDKHLVEITSQYGTLTYLILFAIVFCETGLVVTPILPGDSMLFAAGAIAALDGSGLNVTALIAILVVAAFTGNMLNYSIGKFIGPKVYEGNYRLIKREYLDRAHNYFERYGPLTIVYTRFAPILRTFSPFVAGVGQMPYGKFMIYNFVGGFLWVLLFIFAGFFFGNVPFVKAHFEGVVLGIIVVSLIPAVYAFFKGRMEKKVV